MVPALTYLPSCRCLSRCCMPPQPPQSTPVLLPHLPCARRSSHCTCHVKLVDYHSRLSPRGSSVIDLRFCSGFSICPAHLNCAFIEIAPSFEGPLSCPVFFCRAPHVRSAQANLPHPQETRHLRQAHLCAMCLSSASNDLPLRSFSLSLPPSLACPFPCRSLLRLHARSAS